MQVFITNGSVVGIDLRKGVKCMKKMEVELVEVVAAKSINFDSKNSKVHTLKMQELTTLGVSPTLAFWQMPNLFKAKKQIKTTKKFYCGLRFRLPRFMGLTYLWILR